MDCRWQTVPYLLRDITRAVDCSPGLMDTLNNLTAISSDFRSKRKRVRQTKTLRDMLS
jgi:hypothetical protein